MDGKEKASGMKVVAPKKAPVSTKTLLERATTALSSDGAGLTKDGKDRAVRIFASQVKQAAVLSYRVETWAEKLGQGSVVAACSDFRAELATVLEGLAVTASPK